MTFASRIIPPSDSAAGRNGLVAWGADWLGDVLRCHDEVAEERYTKTVESMSQERQALPWFGTRRVGSSG